MLIFCWEFAVAILVCVCSCIHTQYTVYRLMHTQYTVCFVSNLKYIGTNYTTTQRILLLMVRLLITMAVSSLFYGINRDTFIGDWSLVFYGSLFGWIPVLYFFWGFGICEFVVVFHLWFIVLKMFACCAIDREFASFSLSIVSTW